VSAIRERPVQRYSEVFGLRAEGQGFVVVFDLSSRLPSLLLRWKAAVTVFVVLSLSFQVWRYSPTVAMSLVSTTSTACQSPSAWMIASICILSGDGDWEVRDVGVEEKGRQDRFLWVAVLEASSCAY